MAQVQDILDIVRQLSPDSLAEEWDNVGLLAGDPGDPVHRILIALDPCLALIDQARAGEYDLIITHHPLIFKPLKALRTDSPLGRIIRASLCSDIKVLACHTNLDSTPGGVSDVLAALLKITDAEPLVPSKHQPCPTACGLGRIGRLATAISAEQFLDRLRHTCSPPWILEAGNRPPSVATAAVCGGSCSDFAETALLRGADVFVTAEVKHSVARWAEDAGLWILDAGHFPTENPAMAGFGKALQAELHAAGWDITVSIADQQTPLRLT